MGLSSSAALEVATLRWLRKLLDLPFDDVLIAQLAQRAEIEFAHVRCGIMDQMASSLAGTDRAVLIDTRSLERREVPLPAGSAVLVLDSGVARTLAGSGYNQRRSECERAALALGVPSLRDMQGLDAIEALPEDVLRRRARHVFTENARVLQAAECTDLVEFGRLMNASHASLRDDYEVSTPELDLLVRWLQAEEGVYGARLTGAGFGGACMALCRADAVQQVAACWRSTTGRGTRGGSSFRRHEGSAGCACGRTPPYEDGGRSWVGDRRVGCPRSAHPTAAKRAPTNGNAHPPVHPWAQSRDD